MTKDKWIELFKIINDRLPNDKEIAEALAKGEFTVEHDYYKVSNEEDVKKDITAESINNIASTLSYPSWLIETLKHPSHQLNGQWYYPIINILISSILLSISIGQIFWRVFKMLIDTTIDGRNISMEPNGVQKYTLLLNSWGKLTSFATYFYLISLLFIIQIIILFLPILLDRFSNKTLNWKSYLSARFSYTTILLISNLFTFLSVLFIPTYLVLELNKGIDFYSILFLGFKNFSHSTFKNISGFNTLIVVVSIFIILRLLTNLILLTFSASNITKTMNKLDVIYVKAIYILVGLFLLLFVEKLIASHIFSIIQEGFLTIMR